MVSDTDDEAVMEARVQRLCAEINATPSGNCVGVCIITLHSLLSVLYAAGLRSAEDEAERREMISRMIHTYTTTLDEAGISEDEIVRARDDIRAEAARAKH